MDATTNNTHDNPTMAFRLLDLPEELRYECFKEMLAIKPTEHGKHPAATAPQILSVNKQCHAEGQRILRTINEVDISIESILEGQKPQGVFPSPSEPLYLTVARISFGRRELKRFGTYSSFEGIVGMTVFETAASWPRWLQTMKTINLTVQLRNKIADARALPLEYPDGLFFPVSKFVFSLAYAAKACKKLSVNLETVNLAGVNATVVPDRLLAGLVAFAKVERCEVLVLGSAQTGAKLREAVLGPTPVGKASTRMFEIAERTQNIVGVAWRGPRSYKYLRDAVGAGPSYIDEFKKARKLLDKISRQHPMYSPQVEVANLAGMYWLEESLGMNIVPADGVYEASKQLEAILRQLEEFLTFKHSRALLVRSALEEYRDEEVAESEVTLPDRVFFRV